MQARILVVEDERIVAFNLQQRLLKLGYEVPALAVNAEQALRAVEEHRPDIVLMDIHIEGPLDGIETAARLAKEHPTPVIYLTAYSEDSTLARARATHPYGYLLKPFSERELHATIQMALERHSVEMALNRSEERLRLALSAADMSDWEMRQAHTRHETLYVGQADHILGYPEQAFSGSREAFIQWVAEEDRARVNQVIDDSVACNSTCDLEFRTAHGGEQQRWLRLQGKMMPGIARPLQLVGIIQNITERKVTEQSLKEAAAVFETTADGILILDNTHRIINANASFSSMTGFTLDNVHGKPLEYLTHPSTPADIHKKVQQALLTMDRWRGEIHLRCNDGSSLATLLSLAAVASPRQDSGPGHFVVILTDLTPVRTAEKQLQYLAHYDPLTNIPNRLLSMERLSQALLRARRHDERIAVLFIDLDRFKWVNDTLGHDVGDSLLKVVTLRMHQCLRGSDTIGRLGGDEFLAILDPVDDERSAAVVASKLTQSVTLPVNIDNHTVEISCSIGVSIFPDDGSQADTLVRAADTAMYAAKERGRNCYEFFTPMMLAKAVRFMALNHDLHRGFKAGELRLHYQPQISLVNNRIVGLEALIRWQHPDKGLLGAADVIPVAEDSGLIIDIGEWVVREACRQVRAWNDQGLQTPPIAINVSAFHIQKPHFSQRLSGLLREAGISPASIHVEITESVLQSEGACIATLDELRDLGIVISIDDFGTGYSCLSSLKLLPIDNLKIDKAFIQGIPDDRNDVALTEAIIALARTLGMQVIAEGVETLQQQEFLRSHGCEVVQGYYHYKPLPPDQIQALLTP